MHKPIYFDNRWSGQHGIGRFASELRDRLPNVVPLPIIGPKLSVIDPLASTVALAGRKDGCFFSPGFNPPLHSPIPYAFTLHDLVHLRVPQESSALRRAYYGIVVRPAARKAMKILTVSESSRHEILEWTGVDDSVVAVVGNGVSPAFRPLAPERATRQSYLLHVGRRVGHKNIGNLVRGFALSRFAHALRLVFTGAADLATQQLAADVGIPDRVSFAGPLDDHALAHLYQQAVGLVFPSLHEGFGLPIIEAMACGTPVITSNVGAMPEVAGPGNALLVDPRQPEDLAVAIDRLVDDASIWQDLSQRGLTRSLDFSWERVAARTAAALGVA